MELLCFEGSKVVNLVVLIGKENLSCGVQSIFKRFILVLETLVLGCGLASRL